MAKVSCTTTSGRTSKRTSTSGGVRIVRTAKIEENLVDIETEDVFYELETGFKKGKISDLKERLVTAKKPIFVLIPNLAIAERYAGPDSDNVRAGTMRSMDEVLSRKPSEN